MNHLNLIKYRYFYSFLAMAMLPCISQGVGVVTYVINGLPADSVSQSPSGVDPFLQTSTNIAFPGTEVSLTPGWDQVNALGGGKWTNASVRDTAEYLGFTLQAQVGRTLDVENLSFQWGNGSIGPIKLDVTVEIGNAGETLVGTRDLNLGTNSSVGTTSIGLTVDMLPTGETVTFRLYGYDSSNLGNNNKGGLYDADGTSPFLVDGVIAVPEPSDYAAIFGILGLLGAAYIRKK